MNRLQEHNVSNDVINDINTATINYIKKCSKQIIPRNLIMTKKYLKEHDLLAVPFDKGIGICLMKCQSYENKLMDILKLKQFKKMEKARKNAKEFCIKVEEIINSVLEELNERGTIDKQLLKSIKSAGGQLRRLYGLSKVHKQNIPVRPVLSMPGSPYYKVVKKITEWLSVIPESKISCSSKQTVDNLRNISLDQDEVAISFDVTSLFTNVPVKEVLFEAAEKLYSGKFPMPPVDKETFIILAELATTNILMLTHDGPYRQIDGLAMGSQPAPPLSNIWFSKYEPNIRDDAKPFERYMDDILRTIKQQFN